MELTSDILDYIDAHRQEAFDLLVELAQIPAPSNQEEKRAAFCKNWLEKQGAVGVYIDEALNVIYPVGCEENKPLAVVMAHSDVVFPDTDKLPLTVEGGKIKCPGVGDDTANMVALMMAAKYIAKNDLITREQGLLLVLNSGEEGLGNLKGTRRIFKDFGSRIVEFISLDGSNCGGVNKAVGSKRYRVEIRTEGGHSYGNFGNRNAIAYMASLINTLYEIKVPPVGRTTYNVGAISGGTSVNTIAQQAQMLYEIRSDECKALKIMQAHFEAAIAFYRSKGITVDVELVGDRPCSNGVDPGKQAALMARAAKANRRHYEQELRFGAGSTDCNIPLSLGVPAVCLGCYFGSGAHTREEYVEINSLLPGLKLAFDMILYYCA